MLNLSQGKRKDETFRDIKVRGHFSNIATYADDYLSLSLFSDDACETYAAGTNGLPVTAGFIFRGKYTGETRVKGMKGEEFGDDLDLSTFVGYSVGLGYEYESFACCVIEVKEEKEDLDRMLSVFN